MKPLLEWKKDYCAGHDHEEEYMAETGFPDIEGHKAKHKGIISEMNEILIKRRNFIYLKNNLVNLMHKWLLD